MKRSIFLSQFATAMVFLGLSAPGFAGSSDSCIDYLDRHYKSDLVPVALRNGSKGNIKTLFLKVKNIGSEAFTFYTPTGPAKHIAVRINANRLSFFVPGNIPAGQEIEAEAYEESLDDTRFPYRVEIDVDKEFGQHGCGVLGNDSARLRLPAFTSIGRLTDLDLKLKNP